MKGRGFLIDGSWLFANFSLGMAAFLDICVHIFMLGVKFIDSLFGTVRDFSQISCSKTILSVKK